MDINQFNFGLRITFLMILNLMMMDISLISLKNLLDILVDIVLDQL